MKLKKIVSVVGIAALAFTLSSCSIEREYMKANGKNSTTEQKVIGKNNSDGEATTDSSGTVDGE